MQQWGNGQGPRVSRALFLDHVQGFVIEGNKVHDAQQSGKARWGGGEGIDVKNGTSNGIVRNNEVWNLVQVGLYVDAWRADISNVEIYGNRVHHCANGIALNSEQTGNLSNIRVHDNLSYANGFNGIAVWRFKEHPTSKDIQIYNNTVVGNGVAGSKPYFLPAAQKVDRGIGIAVERSRVPIRNPNIIGLVIRDNLSYGNVSGQLELAEDVLNPVVEHNLIGPVRPRSAVRRSWRPGFSPEGRQPGHRRGDGRTESGSDRCLGQRAGGGQGH